MSTILVTGASRGFGLALVNELLSRPASQISKIFATTRSAAPSLDTVAQQNPDRVVIVQLDVSNEQSAGQAASLVQEKLQGQGLDILINNAGIAQYAPAGAKSMDNLQESLLTNVLGVHWVTRAFLPLLQQGRLKKVANISTTFGSITLAPQTHFMPAPAYKISKAALNALTVQYALDHAKEGFSFMALCPGWMQTDLGGGDMADLTPEQGAKASLDILFKPNEETNGTMPKVLIPGWENFTSGNVYDGKDAPW